MSNTTEAVMDTTPRRKPRYTGKNRFTAKYDEHYNEYTVSIELDLMDDSDETARTTKTYWRNAKHTHWVEEFSGKIVAERRNHHLWVFLNTLVRELNPPHATIEAIKAQVKKAR